MAIYAPTMFTIAGKTMIPSGSEKLLFRAGLLLVGSLRVLRSAW
jgi:hypothetical protein